MSTTDITHLFDRASDNRLAGAGMSSPDLDRYRPYVAHLDIPDARKDAMILAVHRIMKNAVDRAFGDDPVQRSGAHEDKALAKDEAAASPVVELQSNSSNEEGHPLDNRFHRQAIGETDKQEKK